MSQIWFKSNAQVTSPKSAPAPGLGPGQTLSSCLAWLVSPCLTGCFSSWSWATLKANQRSVTFDLPFSLPMTNLREVKSLLPYSISLKSDPTNKAPKYPNMQIPHSHCSAFNYKQLQAPRDHHGLNYFGDASSAWSVHSYFYYLIIWFLVAQIKTPCLGALKDEASQVWSPESTINYQSMLKATQVTSNK